MTTKTKAKPATLFEEQPKTGDVLPPQQQQTKPTGRAVATRTAKPAPPPAKVVPMTDLAKIWETIERLAANRDVDAEKLGKMLDVQERMIATNARMAFDAAMIEMQPDLPVITKSARIVVREKDNQGRRTGEKTQDTPYAKWETLMSLLKPILHKHGFALTHRPSTAPDGRMRVTAILTGHGHTDDQSYMDLAADTTGSKNNAQAWASSMSYAKRHTACAVLNIITVDEDDDGKKGGGAPVVVGGDPMTQPQVDQLIDLCEAVGLDKVRLLKRMNELKPKGHPEATGLGTIPASRFDEAVGLIRNFEAEKKKREDKK